MFKTFKTLFLNIPQQLSWLRSFTHYRDFRETGPGFKKQAAEIRPKATKESTRVGSTLSSYREERHRNL